MNEQEWREKLHKEGFRNIFIWHNDPDVFYPDHEHAVYTAHVILEGEMTVDSQGKTQKIKKGERFDVPAGTIHSARMGPEGCRYIIGEK